MMDADAVLNCKRTEPFRDGFAPHLRFSSHHVQWIDVHGPDNIFRRLEIFRCRSYQVAQMLAVARLELNLIPEIAAQFGNGRCGRSENSHERPW
jgi:hypothetical protein